MLRLHRILKQMKETMEASLADATAAEEKAIGIFDALIAAKEKQINADTAAIESKIERIGNLGVEIETMKGDLFDTAQSMIEDKKILADLDKTCAARSAMMNFLPWQTQSRCTTTIENESANIQVQESKIEEQGHQDGG